MRPSAACIAVYEIPAGVTLEAFRVVKTADVTAAGFTDSFRSHYEMGHPPRKIEVGFAVIHMGVSCWRSESAARGLATAFPKIGSWIARLELPSGKGLNVNAAATSAGGAQHLTIWGDPVKLALSVADVIPV